MAAHIADDAARTGGWRAVILAWVRTTITARADGAFTGTIIGEAILAVLLILVANGLMRGSSG